MSLSEAGGSSRLERAGDAAYDYRRESCRGFDDAVVAVEGSFDRYGFTVRLVHDLQATLASKGFSIKPIRIYELDGTPDLVGRVLSSAGLPANDRSVERLLPCRVNVFVEGERTVVTALRPTLMTRVFPESGLEAPASALEDALVRVVDDAAGC